MGQQVANGSVLSISTGYGAALTVTAASNASSAVLTVTNTLVVGDFVEYVCGWSKVSNKVLRVTAATGTNVTLGGVDTTSTTAYPPGLGVGTIRKANSYTAVSQVLEFTYSGGEPKTKSFQYLESDFETELLLGRSSSRLAMKLGDDLSLAGQVQLTLANDDRLRRAVQLTLPSGGVISYNAVVFFNKSPDVSQDEVISANAVLYLQADPARY